MTKEELEKEAVQSAKKFFGKPTDLVDLDNLRIFKNGYLASAEPREKRIAELEKENAELVQNKYNLEYKIENLENKIEHHQEVIDTFKKENTKLKEKLKPENCLKLLAKEGYVKFTCENGNEHDQLNKAKNLLQKVADVCGYPNYDIPVVLYSEIADFLKDCEVEK